MNHDTVIIGGKAIGETLAEALASGAREVVFLDEDGGAVERAAAAGADAHLIDASASTVLDREGIENPGVAIAASREDGRNLLVAQLLRARRSDRVIALVNDPENVDAFADAGVEPVCASTVLASALDRKRRSVEAPAELEREESKSDGDETESDGRERLRSDGGGGDA